MGSPDPRLVSTEDVAAAPERPPGLARCTTACLRKAAPLLQAQGLAVPNGDRWLLPAATPTAVEACWNLVPGFHGRWAALWDLQTLEGQWGARPFSRADGAAALARADQEAQAGPRHRPSRAAPKGATPQDRVEALAAEEWLAEAPGGLQLPPVSRDAVMLLRFVVSGRVHVPTEALDRLGRIGPPRPRYSRRTP